jgi:hypothetical protein
MAPVIYGLQNMKFVIQMNCCIDLDKKIMGKFEIKLNTISAKWPDNNMYTHRIDGGHVQVKETARRKVQLMVQKLQRQVVYLYIEMDWKMKANI